MQHRIVGPALVIFAALALVGCGSGAVSSGAPAASVASSGPATSAPSQAAPSEAVASEAAASFGIPGFTFPSSDKGLEAVIPDSMCGAKVQKLSLTGDQVFSNASDPTLLAALQALGKTTKDVSAASGFPLDIQNAHCSMFIIRVKGADEARLKAVFLAVSAKEGDTFSEVTVGGKTVLTSDPGSFDYTYVKGDGVIVISADNANDAAALIAALP